jgi:hypothetical protein
VPEFGGSQWVDTTPGRDLRLVLDSISPQLLEPGTLIHREQTAQRDAERDLAAIDEGRNESLVKFVPNIGFALTSDADYLRREARNELGFEGLLSLLNTNAEQSVRAVPEDTVRQDSDKPFVNSNANLLNQAAPMFQIKMPSGEDGSDIGLPSDGFAPRTSDIAVEMDEVLRSTANHDPRKPVILKLTVPGTGNQAIETVAQAYFSGPVGYRTGADGFTGSGKYCLELHGDGMADLYERQTVPGTAWRKVFQFQWAPANAVAGNSHTVVIQTDTYQVESGEMYGKTINFLRTTADIGSDQGDVVKQGGQSRRKAEQSHVSYRALQRELAAVFLDIDQDKLRIFLRRDVRARFAYGTVRYKATQANPARLVGGEIALSAIPAAPRTLTFYLYGDEPTGTVLDVALLRADPNTGPPLTQTGSGDITGRGKWFTFTVPADMADGLFPVISMSPDTEGEHGPIVQAYSVYVPPVSEFGSLPETTTPITAFSFEDGTDDPAMQKAHVSIKDASDDLGSILRVRTSMPCRVELRYQQNPDKWTPIFRGYVRQQYGTRKGGDQSEGMGGDKSTLAAFPSPDWWNYELDLEGEHMRLQELVTFSVLDAGKDTVSGTDSDRDKPMKVTDVIRWLLTEAGYDPLLLDVPDLDTRFFQTEGEYLIEGFTGIIEKIRDLAKNYLGMYLQWDDGAGDYGKWRLRFYPKPSGGADDYNVLAEFHDRPPGGWGAVGGPKLIHDQALYPDLEENHELGSLGTIAQTVKQTFVRHGTLRLTVLPPEANHIVVTGTTAVGEEVNDGDLLVSELFNPYSAEFGTGQPIDPDTNSPDYIGRHKVMAVFSRHFTSQRAVEWVNRRLIDRAGYGVVQYSFSAPAVLVQDKADPDSIRPRFLRYGDAVRYNGATYIVREAEVDVDVAARLNAENMFQNITIETVPRQWPKKNV